LTVKSLRQSLKQLPLAAAANALVKAKWVERDAATTRRRYLARAQRLGIEAPCDDAALRAAVAQRIGQRAAALGWPKKKGDLHIFLAFPLTNWEEVLPNALSVFGRVTTFEWRSLGFNESAPNWVAVRDSMNQALLDDFHAVSREQAVDVVVAYSSGYTLGAEVFVAMAAAGAVTTNFCFDDKVLWPGPKLGDRHVSTAEICSSVDLNLTSDPQGTLKYFVEDGLAMFHPEAADPHLHSPMDLPFEFDVSFIGARFGWRPVLIRELRRHGIEVECFGKGWPNGAVSNDAMREIYAKSRINLGCGGVGYSSSLVCLKGRDFEVPMSGALYLTQDNPELALVFDVGREIVTYRDPADCALIIKQLLEDRGRAASIRTAARERSMRDHTYQARWSRVFDIIGALK
jgi:spore maturation protein CgeB